MQTEQISLGISRMAGRVMEHQDTILAQHSTDLAAAGPRKLTGRWRGGGRQSPLVARAAPAHLQLAAARVAWPAATEALINIVKTQCYCHNSKTPDKKILLVILYLFCGCWLLKPSKLFCSGSLTLDLTSSSSKLLLPLLIPKSFVKNCKGTNY